MVSASVLGAYICPIDLNQGDLSRIPVQRSNTRLLRHAAAFDKGGAVANLLMAPAFIGMMQEAHPSLRRIVAQSATAGLPTPALSSALAYFDGYRQGRGTSNLIQAQRDFFGAHGFERIDEPGAHHGPWGSGAA